MAQEQLIQWSEYFHKCITHGLQHWEKYPPLTMLDHANFHKIVDFGSQGKNTQVHAAQTILKNFGFIQKHRTYPKWVNTLKQLRDIPNPKLNTKIGTMLGLVYWYSGDYQSAENILLQTHKKTVDEHLEDEELQVRYALCLTYWAKNQLPLAEKHIQFVIDTQLDNNNPLQKFSHYSALGMVKLAQKETEQAKKIFSTCIQIAKEINDPTVLGQSFNNMAVFHLKQKQYLKSLRFFGQAAALFEKSENTAALSQIEVIRAWLHLLLGNTINAKAAQDRIAEFESIVDNDLMISPIKELQHELETAIQQ